MKMNKSFLLAVLSLLTVSSLVACSKGKSNQSNDDDEEDTRFDGMDDE